MLKGEDAKYRGRNRKTALFFAAFFPELTKFIPKIVDCGGKSGSDEPAGYAPLHIAVIKGNLEAVKALLAKGADINQETKSYAKFTPLHIAAYTLQPEMVKLLL